MFILWKRRVSKKNKLPKQPMWWEVNYYAYLTQSMRDKRQKKVHHDKEMYLGSIKKIGGKFTRNRRGFFILNVMEKLKKAGFSDEKIREVLDMIRKKIHIPREDFLEELRLRRKFIDNLPECSGHEIQPLHFYTHYKAFKDAYKKD